MSLDILPILAKYLLSFQDCPDLGSTVLRKFGLAHGTQISALGKRPFDLGFVLRKPRGNLDVRAREVGQRRHQLNLTHFLEHEITNCYGREYNF